MATRFSAALQNTNSTDALFRAWAQFIFDTFVTSGNWVQTADTGQVTISTMAHPVAANTQVGYHVYKMADTLQATKPFFLRVAFGSANAAANSPAMTITGGTGSDGAGNITGVLFNAFQVSSQLNGTNASNSYGSADTNRCHLMMFVRTGSTDSLMFSIERTKDPANGNDTGDGFILHWQDTTPGTLTYWVNSSPGAQPPGARWNFVLQNDNVSAFGANVGIGFPLAFKGFVQPVGLGMIVTNQGDFVAAAQPAVSVYGTSHTYQLPDGTSSVTIGAGNSTSATRANVRFGIRYE